MEWLKTPARLLQKKIFGERTEVTVKEETPTTNVSGASVWLIELFVSLRILIMFILCALYVILSSFTQFFFHK